MSLSSITPQTTSKLINGTRDVILKSYPKTLSPSEWHRGSESDIKEIVINITQVIFRHSAICIGAKLIEYCIVLVLGSLEGKEM